MLKLPLPKVTSSSEVALQLRHVPSIASLGVLNPRPTFLWNLCPAFPGIFFSSFLKLQAEEDGQILNSWQAQLLLVPRSNILLGLFLLTQCSPQAASEKPSQSATGQNSSALRLEADWRRVRRRATQRYLFSHLDSSGLASQVLSALI